MQAVVASALVQRILVLILGGVLMIGGLFAYRQLNIEAYPDPVPPLVSGDFAGGVLAAQSVTVTVTGTSGDQLQLINSGSLDLNGNNTTTDPGEAVSVTFSTDKGTLTSGATSGASSCTERPR